MAKNKKNTRIPENSVGGAQFDILTDDSNVLNILKNGKARGYITYEEINNAMPTSKYDSNEVVIVMEALEKNNVKIINHEDIDAEEEIGNSGIWDIDNDSSESDDRDINKGTDISGGASEDPVKMYLREMSNVVLLSKDDEVELAKRIEKAKTSIVSCLCASNITNLTIQSIRSKLVDNIILLCDVIVVNDAGDISVDDYDQDYVKDSDIQDDDQEVCNNDVIRKKTTSLMGKHIKNYDKLYKMQEESGFDLKSLEDNHVKTVKQAEKLSKKYGQNRKSGKSSPRKTGKKQQYHFETHKAPEGMSQDEFFAKELAEIEAEDKAKEAKRDDG